MPWVVRSSTRNFWEVPRQIGQWPEEDHDRAQDAFFKEKMANPTHLVEMAQVGTTILWVVHVGDRADSIFSSHADADAWISQMSRLGMQPIFNPREEPLSVQAHEVVAVDAPEKPRPTLWERLLADD